MTRISHALLAIAAVVVLWLTSAAPASAAAPWLPDENDIEGAYIITGNGPPNVRVDLVRVGSIWTRPHYSDPTINEGEYTSPSGQFRIDEGFCNPGSDCHGGDDEDFQLVFYTGSNAVPMWGSGTPFRILA